MAALVAEDPSDGDSVYAVTSTLERRGTRERSSLETGLGDCLRSPTQTPDAPRILAEPCADGLTLPFTALPGHPAVALGTDSVRVQCTPVCSSTTLHGDGSGLETFTRWTSHSATSLFQLKQTTLAGELQSSPPRVLTETRRKPASK